MCVDVSLHRLAVPDLNGRRRCCEVLVSSSDADLDIRYSGRAAVVDGEAERDFVVAPQVLVRPLLIDSP